MFKFDTTLALQVHLELRSICLVPPTGLNTVTALVAFSHVSMPPFYSGLNWQTTQAWLATSKRLQSRLRATDHLVGKRSSRTYKYINVYTCIYLVLLCMYHFSATVQALEQIELVKELGTCIPTVLQGNIKTILLNAVRIRRNNNNCVLLTVKLTWEYILVCTHIHCNTSLLLDVYWHTLGLKP